MCYSRYKTAAQAFFLTVWIAQSNLLGALANELADKQNSNARRGEPSESRDFSPHIDGNWIGQGVSYGPFREGQSPGGNSPTREELTEDLMLLSQHWSLIRLYGSGGVSGDVLKIISEKNLPIRVMVGAWIIPETGSEKLSAEATEAAKRSNQEEVTKAIELANAYPNAVIAVTVGNETQVHWSDHLTKPAELIYYLRQVREATSVPISTADDFNFWNKPESKQVADEVDFIVTHIHAMWAGLEASKAMPWTELIYADVCKHHPDKKVVIGEAGWATQVHTEGEQAKLIKGKAGEEEQQLYYRQFTDWAHENKIPSFFFEAFDEPWKGGPHPNEVEKHWGLFDVKRKPKTALFSIDAKSK